MRHAVYFAPPAGSLLHELGSSWLGRDAFTGQSLPQPDIEDISEMTADARRYGLHATLKPPFALQRGCSQPELLSAIADLAARQASFEITLRLQFIDAFLALVPAQPSPELDALAAACVRDLDAFRQPADESELSRRRNSKLTDRQDKHLVCWGYPYLFEDYRFHITLTRRLSQGEAARILAAATTHFAAVTRRTTVIGSVSMFTEPSPSAAFTAGPTFSFPTSMNKATS